MIDQPEIVSIADDEVVFCFPAILGPTAVPMAIGEGASQEVVPPPDVIQPALIVRHHSLAPDTEYNFDGVSLHTLPRPAGERLCTIATVNDLHFGEDVCGELGSVPVSPMLRDPAGQAPHSELMNRSVVAEINL
ncbi:MAG TPA: hypothetical protein VMU77_01760, partial [Acidimicrobiales bacterium]|nr:hypothetical protein [Acidimicrobiales bacterium]